jgi:ribonuclease HII
MAGCVLHSEIKGLNDSKKLTQIKRETLFEEIVQNSSFHIVKFSASDIDAQGISECLASGLREIMKNLDAQEYLFDGNSTFGVNGLETMIKADGKVAEVSAASIIAKVTHDRDILKEAKKYPQWEFESHKGYGTKKHIELIKKHGYSPIHRRSYKIKELREPSLFD